MKRIFALIALVFGFVFAANAQVTPVTPNIGLRVPLYNTQNWNVPLNYNFNLLDQLLSGKSPLPALSVTGTMNIPAPTLNNVTGLTQCLHVNSSGTVSGTGSDCDNISLQTNSTPNASQSTLNFSNTNPAAPSGYTNVLWQNSGGNESAYVPTGAGGVASITDTTSATGAITFAGSGVSQSGNTFTFTGGAANGVQYNPSTTNYIFYSDSLPIVSTQNETTATAVSCNGTTCTITDPNSYTAGQPVQFAANTSWSPACLNWMIGTVLSTGLSSTQFEVSQTALYGNGGGAGCAGTQSGTGGSVQDASYFWPFAAGKLPFFNGHGTIIDQGIAGGQSSTMVSDYTAAVHPYTTAVTGNPSYVFIKVSVNDWSNGISGPCTPLSTEETNFQTLFTDAHADGAKVVAVTSQSWPVTGSVCPNGYQLMAQTNDWIRAQGKSSTNASSGKYWDYLIDLAQVFTNYTDPNWRITVSLNQDHLNDAGNAVAAQMTNEEMALQGSPVLAQPTCNEPGTTSANYVGGANSTPCLDTANTFSQGQTISSGDLDVNSGKVYAPNGSGTFGNGLFVGNNSNSNVPMATVNSDSPYGTDIEIINSTPGGIGWYIVSEGNINNVAGIFGLSNNTNWPISASTASVLMPSGFEFGWGGWSTYPTANFNFTAGFSQPSAGVISADTTATGNSLGTVKLGVIDPQSTQTTVTGTTAGAAVWSQPQQGSAFKQAVIYLSGYENTTATAQTITLPSSFATVGYVVTDGGSCAGVTISGPTVTLPASMGSAQTGLCEVKGY